MKMLTVACGLAQMVGRMKQEPHFIQPGFVAHINPPKDGNYSASLPEHLGRSQWLERFAQYNKNQKAIPRPKATVATVMACAMDDDFEICNDPNKPAIYAIVHVIEHARKPLGWRRAGVPLVDSDYLRFQGTSLDALAFKLEAQIIAAVGSFDAAIEHRRSLQQIANFGAWRTQH